MADQEQQQSGSETQDVDLSQQITDAIQPVMQDLQRQITETVQQQLQQVGGAPVGTNGTGALSLDNLGPIGETLQSSLDTAVESLKPFFQWILEKLQQLVSLIAGLITGQGTELESEEAQAGANA